MFTVIWKELVENVDIPWFRNMLDRHFVCKVFKFSMRSGLPIPYIISSFPRTEAAIVNMVSASEEIFFAFLTESTLDRPCGVRTTLGGFSDSSISQVRDKWVSTVTVAHKRSSFPSRTLLTHHNGNIPCDSEQYFITAHITKEWTTTIYTTQDWWFVFLFLVLKKVSTRNI